MGLVFSDDQGYVNVHIREVLAMNSYLVQLFKKAAGFGTPGGSKRLELLLPPGHRIWKDPELALENLLFLPHLDYPLPDGQTTRLLDIQLNTGMKGTDAQRLFTRLYGQARAHLYVEGHNRAWLADLMEQALAEGHLRRNFEWTSDDADPTGWEAVVSFLRQNATRPAVTSMSSGGQIGFPSAETAQWSGNPEAWEALSIPEKYAMALERLRALATVLELSPGGLAEISFGPGGYDAEGIIALALA